MVNRWEMRVDGSVVWTRTIDADGVGQELVICDRAASGRFLPGVSGNPAGRPVVLAEVVEAARRHSLDAVAVLAEIMNDKTVHPYARARAAIEIKLIAFGGKGAPPSPAAGDVRTLSDAELAAVLDGVA